MTAKAAIATQPGRTAQAGRRDVPDRPFEYRNATARLPAPAAPKSRGRTSVIVMAVREVS
jgi:hypothetical protein